MADYLEDGIYELRPKDNRIFTFYLRDRVILIHAIKNVKKVPENDLRLCVKERLKQKPGEPI